MRDFFDFVAATWSGAPAMARGFAVLLAGWLGALLTKAIVRGLLALLRFDRFADKVGLGAFLEKGKVDYRPAKLVSVLSYWLAMVIVFVMASRTLDIAAVNRISDGIVDALPALFAGIFVTIIGLVIVTFLGNVIETIARNAAFGDARAVARIFRYIGFAAILILASDQLGLGKGLLSTFLVIGFAAISLAFAIAFGFGSVDLARETMQNLLKKLNERSRKE
ncbi:MAG: hypothetical protein JNG85_00575 [Spirochaetaceae bacterium]|nr:hypothetical protein [Spirochaetaceae bacterium]